MEETNNQIEIPSLISHDASTAIKGLMMLLIILGHTEMLTPNFAKGERTFLYFWLYSFHVYIFFILPIIYGVKRDSIARRRGVIDGNSVLKNSKHNLIKIGVPYFWFFLFSTFIYLFVGKGNLNIWGVLYAFIFGNEPLIDRYIGFNFLWFLPAMLALLFLKSIWYHSAVIVKMAIITISVVLWGLTILGVVTRYQIGMYAPFAISHGFYFIIYGLISRWIIERHIPTKILMPSTIVLSTVLSFLICYKPTMGQGAYFNVSTIIRLLMPILVFLLLYCLRRTIAKSRLLSLIGRYSLQIYLFHVFVINGLVQLSFHFIEPSICLRIVVFVLATIISTGISVFVVKTPLVNKLLFPIG